MSLLHAKQVIFNAFCDNQHILRKRLGARQHIVEAIQISLSIVTIVVLSHNSQFSCLNFQKSLKYLMSKNFEVVLGNRKKLKQKWCKVLLYVLTYVFSINKKSIELQ